MVDACLPGIHMCKRTEHAELYTELRTLGSEFGAGKQNNGSIS